MIHVHGVDYAYQNKEKVLNDLSFDVPENSIFGFLGKNGSGKTTTIRILLNLCTPSKGEVTIDQHVISSTFYSQFRTIGALIEEPTFYTQLSGKQNLRFLAHYHGISEKRIDEVLSVVGLSGVEPTTVKKYSMGMKQRLGIAQAILHDPKILILDEPINGLDPQGIMEMRELLLALKQAGKTIFISSHLLSEVEKICDSVCIIEKGKKLFSGDMAALQAHISKTIVYRIQCDDAPKAFALLKEQQNVLAEVITEKELKIIIEQKIDISRLIKTLVLSHINLFEVAIVKNSLEDIFFKLTDSPQ